MWMDGKSAVETPRIRVSTKNKTPKGLMLHSAIDLNRLPRAIKLRILTGYIEWLFILGYPGASRSSTGESGDLRSRRR